MVMEIRFGKAQENLQQMGLTWVMMTTTRFQIGKRLTSVRTPSTQTQIPTVLQIPTSLLAPIPTPFFGIQMEMVGLILRISTAAVHLSPTQTMMEF
jgi:hypothetical protein